MFHRRVKSHVFEKIVAVFLVLFAIAAIYLFIEGAKFKTITEGQIILLELDLIIITILLSLALIGIKIYEKVE